MTTRSRHRLGWFEQPAAVMPKHLHTQQHPSREVADGHHR
jgi:hypothetical protein